MFLGRPVSPEQLLARPQLEGEFAQVVASSRDFSLIGPHACGKTSFIRSQIERLHATGTGCILVDIQALSDSTVEDVLVSIETQLAVAPPKSANVQKRFAAVCQQSSRHVLVVLDEADLLFGVERELRQLTTIMRYHPDGGRRLVTFCLVSRRPYFRYAQTYPVPMSFASPVQLIMMCPDGETTRSWTEGLLSQQSITNTPRTMDWILQVAGQQPYLVENAVETLRNNRWPNGDPDHERATRHFYDAVGRAYYRELYDSVVDVSETGFAADAALLALAANSVLRTRNKKGVELTGFLEEGTLRYLDRLGLVRTVDGERQPFSRLFALWLVERGRELATDQRQSDGMWSRVIGASNLKDALSLAGSAIDISKAGFSLFSILLGVSQ